MPMALLSRFGVTFTSGEMGSTDAAKTDTDSEKPSLSLALTIELTKDGTLIERDSQIPDKPMWAGISWVLHHYSLEPGTHELTIKQSTEPRKRLLAEAYQLIQNRLTI